MEKLGRFLLLLLCLLGLTDAGQEAVQLLNLYDPDPIFLRSLPSTGHFPASISVTEEELPSLSSSLSMAESWLETWVLPTKATGVVLGKGVLCNPRYRHNWSLVLTTLRNIHRVLKKLGLEKDMRVSAAFSNDCFAFSNSQEDDLMLKPLLRFLRASNSTYSISPPDQFSSSLGEIVSLVSFHEANVKRLGFSSTTGINLIVSHFRKKDMERAMSSFSCSKLEEPMEFLGRKLMESYPERTTAGPFSSIPRMPDPPHGSSSLPNFSPSSISPVNPPGDSALPPCLAAPTPEPPRVEQWGVWCVAKPSVPEDELQEAMDYACGEGGADCEEIKPHRSCYSPDTVVAHASYAFNSYWQKYKNRGGSCNFGGTAMIVNSDPSFLQCKFILL